MEKGSGVQPLPLLVSSVSCESDLLCLRFFILFDALDEIVNHPFGAFLRWYLDEVKAGATIAFDEERTIFTDSNIPTDQMYLVVNLCGLFTGFFDFIPIGNFAAVILCAVIGVFKAVQSHIHGVAFDFAGFQIDNCTASSGMNIIGNGFSSTKSAAGEHDLHIRPDNTGNDSNRIYASLAHFSPTGILLNQFFDYAIGLSRFFVKLLRVTNLISMDDLDALTTKTDLRLYNERGMLFKKRYKRFKAINTNENRKDRI